MKSLTVKTRKTRKSIIGTKSVEPKEFIAELQGFIKKGSRVPKSDPLKAKPPMRGKRQAWKIGARLTASHIEKDIERGQSVWEAS